MSFKLTDNIKKAIAKELPLHDIVHGEVLNEIIETQELESEYYLGYQDALQKVYGFIYALIFEDLDQKRGAKV